MSSNEITRLLLGIREGDLEATHALLPLVYEELREMAHHRLYGGQGVTLDTTGLVHDAYLKLFDRTQLSINDRRHFFAVASKAMRQIIVDHARHRLALKHGGGQQRVDLDAEALPAEDKTMDILSLDEALQRLSQVDERLARVVELRFFGGLSVEETAEVLDIDARTVKRDWRKARALLYADLADPETS